MVRDPRRDYDDDEFGRSQYGLTRQERDEIAGRALGGHLFDAMEDVMGGPGSFRATHVMNAWADAHKHWAGHDVKPDRDDDDYPVVHIPGKGGWHGRYPVGGPYVDMYHEGTGPFDVIHVDKSERTNPKYITERIHEFSDETDPNWYR